MSMGEQVERPIAADNGRINIQVSEWTPDANQPALPNGQSAQEVGQLYRLELWPLPQEVGRAVVQAMIDAAHKVLEESGLGGEWSTSHEDPSDPLVMPVDRTIQ